MPIVLKWRVIACEIVVDDKQPDNQVMEEVSFREGELFTGVMSISMYERVVPTFHVFDLSASQKSFCGSNPANVPRPHCH